MSALAALRTIVIGATLAIMCTDSTNGSQFFPGSLLVTQEDTLLEVSRSGALFQSTNIPYPDGASCPACEHARDVVTLSFDRAYVYNGTFDPHVSTFDAAAGTWSHRTFAGLSTGNNRSYGGIAIKDQFVFMTDMRTGTGDDEQQGIVRFDLNGGPTLRFATDIEPIDLSLGLDGYLYALDGPRIRVFDPVSMASIKTISVRVLDARAVAADQDGSLFVLSFVSNLYHFDSDGGLLNTHTLLNEGNLIDVDIAVDGTVAVGNRFGTVIVTDRAFSSAMSFSVGR